jgi:hypothetical protein
MTSLKEFDGSAEAEPFQNVAASAFFGKP